MRLRRTLALPSFPNRLSLAVAALCATASAASWAAGGVVISQVFAGGGNTGAPFQRDYVELFNAGSAAVSLASCGLISITEPTLRRAASSPKWHVPSHAFEQ